jgi:hypothetical protein
MRGVNRKPPGAGMPAQGLAQWAFAAPSPLAKPTALPSDYKPSASAALYVEAPSASLSVQGRGRRAQVLRDYGAASASRTAAAALALPPPPAPRLASFGGEKIAGYSADLMAYELLKSMLNEKPTGREAELLEIGQQALDDARAKIDFGRGGVSEDIVETTGESKIRATAAKEMSKRKKIVSKGLKKHDAKMAVSASSASFAQAGNCGEFSAMVGMHLLAGGVGKDTLMLRVDNMAWDHMWMEMAEQTGLSKAELRVVVDGWADGPAVLHEDSFSLEKKQNEKQGTIVEHAINLEKIKYIFQHYQKVKQELIRNFDLDTMLVGISSKDIGRRVCSTKKIPTLGKNFLDKTVDPNPQKLSAQIQAVGVLRHDDDLAPRMSVQAAVAAAPEVIDAAVRLRAQTLVNYESYLGDEQVHQRGDDLLLGFKDYLRVRAQMEQRASSVATDAELKSAVAPTWAERSLVLGE